MDLLVVTIASVVLVILAVFGGGVVQLALGLVFVLFFPGYTLMSALFPKRGDLDGAQRLALSFGLSIVVVPLLGLILNFTPWGIRLLPVLISVLLFIAVMAGLAWYRRRRLSPEQRFEVRFGTLSWSYLWSRQTSLNRALSVLLVLVIIMATGALVYLVKPPQVEEKFTEFYILDSHGRAENYPKVLILGEEAELVLGIVNREQKRTDYKIEITISKEKVAELGPISLADGEKWEQPVSFAPTKVGDDQKVAFMLYKGSKQQAEQVLNLWIDVLKSP